MITCYLENNKKRLFRHATTSAIVVKGNKVLLVKRTPKAKEGNKYCFPGGFLDRNETLSQAILREVKEETGYKGKILGLYRINDNPKRGNEDRQNVDFVFLVKPGRKVSKPDWEIKEVRWFKLNNLPKPEEFAFDNYETIMFYLTNKKKLLDL